jgi:serine/threonine-protein kinase Stk1
MEKAALPSCPRSGPLLAKGRPKRGDARRLPWGLAPVPVKTERRFVHSLVRGCRSAQLILGMLQYNGFCFCVRPEVCQVSGVWREWEGQVVDGLFPLQRFLGNGEQSAVFLTRYGDSEPQNAVIKLVRTDPENAELELSRWTRAAQLSHPHLVRIFQVGIWQAGDEGLPYAVMEYGEENLADVLRDRPFTVVEAREMLEPVLDALAYLHGEGFVHGRVKAANIIAVDDQVKVSSDGICKAGELRGGSGHPSASDPPEFQTEGASPSGDVWSLGVTLVEALTQHLPSQEGANNEPVLPEALPAEFIDIARHCLQVDPQRRATVAELVDRLRQTSSAASVSEEHVAVESQQTSGRWRYAGLAAAAAGLALAAIFAGPGLLRRTTTSAVEKPKAQSEASLKPAQPPADQLPESTSTEKRDSASTASSAPRRSDSVPNVTGSATMGQVIHQVLPEVPRQARDTISGMVKVSVRAGVDASGNVVSATLDSAGPSRYFAALTLAAARRWKFRPPQLQGRDVPSEWILRFQLTKAATNVRPVQVSP